MLFFTSFFKGIKSFLAPINGQNIIVHISIRSLIFDQLDYSQKTNLWELYFAGKDL